MRSTNFYDHFSGFPLFAIEIAGRIKNCFSQKHVPTFSTFNFSRAFHLSPFSQTDERDFIAEQCNATMMRQENETFFMADALNHSKGSWKSEKFPATC
jgi:hypothetical protein